MISRRPARRDPGAWVGGLVPRGRSVPRWVGRPTRPAPRHVPTTPRIVRHRRRRDATVDKSRSAAGRGAGLRTRIARMTRRTGHLRGRRGRSRGAIGGPVRGRCRPRRRRGPFARPPLLPCRHTRRIDPEPARRRRGGRPLGPWLTTGGRRRPVRARTPVGRIPSARARRPILPRPLVNRCRPIRRPIGRGLGPVPPRPLVGRCPRTILASRLPLGRDRRPVLTRRLTLHTPNLTGGRRPILRIPNLTGGWSPSLNPPRRLCGRRLVVPTPAATDRRSLASHRPRRCRGGRRRRRPGLGAPNYRRRFPRRRLLPGSGGRRFRPRPARIPSRALPASTGPLHRGRRLLRIRGRRTRVGAPLRTAKRRVATRCRPGLGAGLESGRWPRLHPERGDQPVHRSRTRLVGRLVRGGAELGTRLRNVRRTGLRGVRPGGFGGLWWETPEPVGGVGRSVHASSLVRPPGRASGPAYRGRRASATALVHNLRAYGPEPGVAKIRRCLPTW
jgi:hypothetical protein